MDLSESESEMEICTNRMSISSKAGTSHPNISVVMCTYNGERYLPEQLQSIAEQTRQPAELVASDDGSTDQTIEILTKFSERASFPVRIVRNCSRLGSSSNFDQAIRLARGELIALCDQDDRWVPQKLEVLSDILANRPKAGGIFSDACLIDCNSRPLAGRLFAKSKFTLARQKTFRADPIAILLRHCLVCGATLMLRATLARSMPAIPKSWVHDAWLAWMIALNSTLEFTEEPLIDYRVHNSQQIGIGGIKASGKAGDVQESLRAYYQRVASQFTELLGYVDKLDVRGRDGIIKDIRWKIAFLERESSLSPRRATRALEIAQLLPGYMRYSRGFGAIRQDAFMP